MKPSGISLSARVLWLMGALVASNAMGCMRVPPRPGVATTHPSHDLGFPQAKATDSTVDEEIHSDGEEESEEHGDPFAAPTDVPGHDDDRSDDGGIDDDWEPPAHGHPSVAVAQSASPLARLSSEELKHRVKSDLPSLGSISFGPPNRGRLINGVQMQAGVNHRLTAPSCAWGTAETVEGLSRAIDKVYKQFPSDDKLIIGHISTKFGGRLHPHKSHQTGRDVDVSYFYKQTKNWYTVANANNLDSERTWAFIKALLTESRVEMIFIDSSLQRVLKQYALSKGEDAEWLDEVFQFGGKSRWPIIRHVRGHATHIHVRFLSPQAQANALIAGPYLPRRAKATVEAVASRSGAGALSATKYVMHRARSGDTLDSLARRYGTTVQAIREANAIRGNAIKIKHTYRIPVAAKDPAKKEVVARKAAPEVRSRRGSAKHSRSK